MTTFSSTCGPIVKIVFHCTAEDDALYGPGGFTVTAGEYVTSGKMGVWTGSSEYVAFTAATRQVRATRIDVYVDDGESVLYSPIIQPASGTYYDAILVTITCWSQDAVIYYTLDGSDPTTASTVYTQPFTVSNDLTIKAVAERDGELSEVVSAEYKFTMALPIGFGMLEEVDDGTVVTMAYDATVIGQSGSYLFAFDWTGYGEIFGSVGYNYKMGDVIPAGFRGVKTTWSCEPELKDPQGFQAPIGHVDLVPEEITLDQVNHGSWGHYVVIRNVRIDKSRIVLMDGNGLECNFYNRFSIVIPDDPTALYDVYGVVGSYGHNGDCIYQILPLKIVCHGGDPLVCCIEDVLAYPEGQPVQFECPLIVVYQGGNYLFVKDKCDEYTLMYGNMNGTFENGDSTIGAVTWTKYQQIPQLVPYGDWSLVAHGSQVSPVGPIDIEKISRDMVHWYVYFEDVTVVKDEERDRYYTMIDNNGDEMLLYNQFNIEIPTPDAYPVGFDPDIYNGVSIVDINRVIHYILTGKWPDYAAPVTRTNEEQNSWEHCRVEGIVAFYKNEYELFPTKVIADGYVPDPWPSDPFKRYDVNQDGAINISDVNILIELILYQ